MSSGVAPACTGRAGLWEKSCGRRNLSTPVPAGAGRTAPGETCPGNSCFGWENVAIAGSLKHQCHSYCSPQEPDTGREGCRWASHDLWSWESYLCLSHISSDAKITVANVLLPTRATSLGLDLAYSCVRVCVLYGVHTDTCAWTRCVCVSCQNSHSPVRVSREGTRPALGRVLRHRCVWAPLQVRCPPHCPVRAPGPGCALRRFRHGRDSHRSRRHPH